MAVELGNWWTICCCCDAKEIKTQEDIDYLNDLLPDNDRIGIKIYKTKEDLVEKECSCDSVCYLIK